MAGAVFRWEMDIDFRRSRAPHATPETHAAFSAKEQATGVVSSRPLCLATAATAAKGGGEDGTSGADRTIRAR